LAGKQVATVESLSYSEVKTSFPSSLAAFDASGLSQTTGRTDSEFPNFTYEVSKQFLKPLAGASNFMPSDTDQGLMKVTVEVQWDGKSFNTSALKVR
jgi:hypothetical protein